MRVLVLIGLAGTAACSGDTGLALTISAPEGPATVSRLEIVLASPAFEMAGSQLSGGNVRYYRQKTTAGEIKDPPALDGYVLRIEGRGGGGKLVPFVIAYDARPQPIAAGMVLDSSQLLPLPLEVPGSSRIEATVTMAKLAPADPMLGVASGQIAELPCAPASNASPWRSGIAWQPQGGPQLRLLLPDPAGGSLDATGRPLDLDCDGYAANDGDCDDVRTRFNPGAAEACDGEDVNCDGAHYAITACDAPDARCGADGVNFCQDVRGGTAIGQSVSSPQCL